VFLWEGVTNYLAESAVDATLRYVGTAASSSRIFFTYVDSEVLRPDSAFHGADAVRAVLRHVEEPWTFGLDPMQLPQYLSTRGLRLISDVDSTRLRAQYLGNHGSQLRGYEFYRAAVAEVPRLGRSRLEHEDATHSEG
jgi:O-methyltransferase involved in polyketide biosynthesis